MASVKWDLHAYILDKLKIFNPVFLSYSPVLKYSKKLTGRLLSSCLLWEDDVLRVLSRCW